MINLNKNGYWSLVAHNKWSKGLQKERFWSEACSEMNMAWCPYFLNRYIYIYIHICR